MKNNKRMANLIVPGLLWTLVMSGPLPARAQPKPAVVQVAAPRIKITETKQDSSKIQFLIFPGGDIFLYHGSLGESTTLWKISSPTEERLDLVLQKEKKKLDGETCQPLVVNTTEPTAVRDRLMKALVKHKFFNLKTTTLSAAAMRKWTRNKKALYRL